MMILKSRKIISLLLVLIMFSSCEEKSNFDNYDITLANLFVSYGDNIENDINFLNEKIKAKEVLLPSTLYYDKFESINIIITNYYNYLNELDLKSEKLNKNLFFEGDILAEDGKKFHGRSKIFLDDLNRVIENKDLKDHLIYYFNVDDVKNKEDLYFKYLDYNYLGAPYPVFRYLIKKRKYDLMLFKNELLSSYLQRR